jgi:hypothetical protein
MEIEECWKRFGDRLLSQVRNFFASKKSESPLATCFIYGGLSNKTVIVLYRRLQREKVALLKNLRVIYHTKLVDSDLTELNRYHENIISTGFRYHRPLIN